MTALADADTQGDQRIFLLPWKDRSPLGRTIGIWIERMEREQLLRAGIEEPAKLREATVGLPRSVQVHDVSGVGGLTLERLIRRERDREEAGADGFITGTRREIESLDCQVTIVIVQPGLSREAKSTAQASLLASADGYLCETYDSDFRVIGSQ
jgi:hypothetical protein